MKTNKLKLNEKQLRSIVRNVLKETIDEYGGYRNTSWDYNGWGSGAYNGRTQGGSYQTSMPYQGQTYASYQENSDKSKEDIKKATKKIQDNSWRNLRQNSNSYGPLILSKVQALIPALQALYPKCQKIGINPDFSGLKIAIKELNALQNELYKMAYGRLVAEGWLGDKFSALKNKAKNAIGTVSNKFSGLADKIKNMGEPRSKEEAQQQMQLSISEIQKYLRDIYPYVKYLPSAQGDKRAIGRAYSHIRNVYNLVDKLKWVA